MTTIAAEKSRVQNRLEGFALVALFQGFPTFATAGMLLKLAGHGLVGATPGAVVATSTVFYALLVIWLGPKYPKLFKAQFDPVFLDATLSFSEKLARWRVGQIGSLQLVTNVWMLSLLAVAVLVQG